MKEQILNLYNEIFDENGNVKSCGRKKCKQLINLLTEEYPDRKFGDSNTGFMNIKEIKAVLSK